jgi:hypothetical protein
MEKWRWDINMSMCGTEKWKTRRKVLSIDQPAQIGAVTSSMITMTLPGCIGWLASSTPQA